jgi:hypothetical protein
VCVVYKIIGDLIFTSAVVVQNNKLDTVKLPKNVFFVIIKVVVVDTIVVE